jgi:hypothetical protein
VTTVDAEHELAQTARAQGGVFSRAQAHGAGFSRSGVAHRLQRGSWVVVHGRVLAASTTVLGHAGLLWAALLVAGPASVVSHTSAAGVWGLGVRVPAVVELTTTASRTPAVPGALVRRRALADDDVTDVHGMRVTTRRRTALDCLATVPVAEASALLDRCWRAGILTPLQLAQAGRDRRGSTGVQQLRLLADGPHPGQVWFPVERLAGVLRRAGVSGWHLHHEVAPGVVAPLVFPAERLAVLVGDRLPWQRRRDDQLCADLVLAGWAALVLDWHVAAWEPSRAVAVLGRARTAAGRRTRVGP